MIRPAVASDAQAVSELIDRAYEIYIPRIGKRPMPMTADHAAEIGRGETFVLELDDRVAGVIVLVRQGDRLQIENIAVDPAVQGRGLGRRLLGFAETTAVRLGCTELTLYTNALMTENIRFYGRAGFTVTGERTEHGFSRVFFSRPVGGSTMPPLTDTRLQKLADLLCRYSLDVQPGDLVLVYTPAIAQPLVVEVVKAVTRMGGHTVLRVSLESVESIRLERSSKAQLETVTPLDHLDQQLPQKILSIWANENARYLAQVPSEHQSQQAAALEPIDQELAQRMASGDVHWCGTLYPCQATAQEAGMSLPDWEDFVYSAGHIDDPDPILYWQKRSEEQQQVADRLAKLETIRIVADETDLTVNVAGRPWLNADGRENFPDGEVFTSPHHEATEGHIKFSFAAVYAGKMVRGVRLWFEGGRVVRATADQGQEHLETLLDTDDGARYLGEVAFGLNDEIQIATGETLFDEKIGGTCHVALGTAFPEASGTNRSGIHWDIVCDLRENAQVYGDGELIFENGRFV